MRRMVLSRSARSVIACVTALVLLLCQTAFAAQACVHPAAVAPVEHGAAAPCHDPAGGAPANELPAPSACEAANAVPDAAKLPVLALSDLRATPVVYEQLAAGAGSTRNAQMAQAVCHSPPLSVLHCRFLN